MTWRDYVILGLIFVLNNLAWSIYVETRWPPMAAYTRMIVGQTVAAQSQAAPKVEKPK